MLVQVGNYIYPLVEGQPLQIQAGQTLRVFFAFTYKVAETIDARIWVALYTKFPVTGRRMVVEGAERESIITLDKAMDWQTYQGHIDFSIGSGVKASVYGLGLELPDFKNDAGDYIDDCIEVIAAPGMMEMLGPLIMIAMMGMMVPMLTGMPERLE